MARTRLSLAKRDIVMHLSSAGRHVYRRKDFVDVLRKNRETWRLRQDETVASFLEYLVHNTELRRVAIDYPYRKEIRYVWGDVPFYEVVQATKPSAYFSHYSAMFFHELTEQVPKTIYLNDEQTPKPSYVGDLRQERIDAAFRRPVRVSRNVAKYGGYRICVLNGKHLKALGVEDMIGPEDARIRVTGVERTLIDATVRPNYAGGVFEVLNAFRQAADRVSANRMSAFLSKMQYVYPYHQAIGFYMEMAGNYRASQVELFRKQPMEFDFYLAHQIGEPVYNERWRIFHPDGL